MCACAAQNPLLQLPLPALRDDVTFRAGQEAFDGSPVWIVEDPVTGQYVRLGWVEAAILRRIRRGMRMGLLLERLRRETTIRAEPAFVLEVCRQAEGAGLTDRLGRTEGAAFEGSARSRDLSPVSWFLHHYLFLPIPLLRPEPLLRAGYPWVRWLASGMAVRVHLAVWCMALVLLAGRAGEFFGAFEHLLTPLGVLYSAFALTGVKAVHEFAHAFAARHYGVRVRGMGIALMVFWPIPYTDVTDAWALRGRRERFWIGAAGVAAEFFLAGWALLAWSLVPPGAFRSVCFLVSSVTLLSTFLVNLNPAMRFDGYYLLGDVLGIENLRARAGAVLRWRVDRWLLGIPGTNPEPGMSRRLQAFLLVFSVYGGLYRLVLYVGIGLVVYLEFTRSIGVFLLAYQLWASLVMPLVREVRRMIRLRKSIRLRPRLLALILVGGVGVAWVVVPMPRTLVLGYVVVPESRQILHAPFAGVLRDFALEEGREVEAGTLLFSVDAAELEAEEAVLRHELDILDILTQRHATLDADSADAVRAWRERDKVLARLGKVTERRGQGMVRAAVPGVVSGVGKEWREGVWIGERAVLGEVLHPGRRLVVYVPEMALRDVAHGTRATVSLPDGSYMGGTVSGWIRVSVLPPEHAALAATFGGVLPVQVGRGGDRDGLPLVGGYYQAFITTDAPLAGGAAWRTGVLRIRTEPASLLRKGVRHVWRVVLHESGL